MFYEQSVRNQIFGTTKQRLHFISVTLVCLFSFRAFAQNFDSGNEFSDTVKKSLHAPLKRLARTMEIAGLSGAVISFGIHYAGDKELLRDAAEQAKSKRITIGRSIAEKEGEALVRFGDKGMQLGIACLIVGVVIDVLTPSESEASELPPDMDQKYRVLDVDRSSSYGFRNRYISMWNGLVGHLKQGQLTQMDQDLATLYSQGVIHADYFILREFVNELLRKKYGLDRTKELREIDNQFDEQERKGTLQLLAQLERDALNARSGKAQGSPSCPIQSRFLIIPAN